MLVSIGELAHGITDFFARHPLAVEPLKIPSWLGASPIGPVTIGAGAILVRRSKSG
jgi:hypothetical protein